MPNTNNLTTLNTYLSDIGNAIRNKGISGNFTVGDMASNIDNITTGGSYGTLNVTTNGVYSNPSPYDAWNVVDVQVPTSVDLSNSVIWNTNNNSYIGENVIDISGSFSYKSFRRYNSLNRNYYYVSVNVPYKVQLMGYAFASAPYANASFEINSSYIVDYVNVYSIFYNCKNLSTGTFKSFLDFLHNKVNVETTFTDTVYSNMLAFASLESLAGYNSPENSWIFAPAPSSTASLFSQSANIGYVNLNFMIDMPTTYMGFGQYAFNSSKIIGAKLRLNFLGDARGKNFNMYRMFYNVQRLKSFDIHVDINNANFISSDFINNSTNLSDAWLSLNGNTNLSIANLYVKANNSLSKKFYLGCSNLISFNNGFWASGNLVLILNNRDAYNIAVNSKVFPVTHTFVESVSPQSFTFNFYNENNQIIYTREVNTVIGSWESSTNLGIYCTE